MSRIIKTQHWLAMLLTAGFAFSVSAYAGEPVESVEPAEEEQQQTEESTEADATAVEETSGDVLVIEEEAATTDESSASDAPKMMRKPDFPTPTRGMSMAGVRDAFGEPNTEHPAVGEPPITRWDYDRFSVFFEYDKVLHSVATE